MAIEKVKKVLIAGLAEDFDKIAKQLQRLRMLHIDKLESQEDLSSLVALEATEENDLRADKELSRAAAALEFYKKYNPAKKGLFNARPEVTETEIHAQIDPVVENMLQKQEVFESQLHALRTQETQAANKIAQLEPYASLSIRVDSIKESRSSLMMLGSVSADTYEEMAAEIAEFGGSVEVVELLGKDYYCFIAATRSDEEALQAALRKAGFAQAAQLEPGIPAQEIARLQAEIADVEKQRAAIDEQANAIAADMPALQRYYDQCAVLNQRVTLRDDTLSTQKAFLLTGWVRESQMKNLEDKLLAANPDLYIEFSDPAEGELQPTALKNSKLIWPFEAVTDMYSTPLPDEFDPNPVMAPFFFVFFGMMLSDAGYGIILSLFSVFLLKRNKPGTGMMGKILTFGILGGISTVIWGALFGGWFGEELLPHLWFIPMNEPMTMMVLCLGFGVIHISAGMIVKFVALWKAGDKFAAVADQCSPLAILWGACILLVGAMVLTGAAGTAVTYIGGAMAIAGALGLLLTQGRSSPTIIGKITGGLSSLYGLTGYLSDVLSYSRLFGLSLATGVIGMVFNTIALMLMGNPIGIIFGVVVLLVGHGFNMAINVLGAYVHACRLQYIEFYSKFFEGGGRAFTPFGYGTKYVSVKN